MKDETMELTEHQIIGFEKGSICPSCKQPNIIFRSWRNDFICGWCKKVFKKIRDKIKYLGNQRDLL